MLDPAQEVISSNYLTVLPKENSNFYCIKEKEKLSLLQSIFENRLTQRSLLNAATFIALLQAGLIAPGNVLFIFIIKLWKNTYFTCVTGQVTLLRTQLVEHELETTFGNKKLLVTTLGRFQIQENYFHQYILNLGSFIVETTEGMNLTTMKQLPNTRGKRATAILY